MLQDIQKYTGLMIAVLIVFFIGLVFWFDGARANTGGANGPYYKAYGKNYSEVEFGREVGGTARVAEGLQSLINGQNFELSGKFIGDLASLGGGYPVNYEKVFVNRLTIQKASLKYGTQASEEEVFNYLKSTFFTDATGGFDSEGYEEFMTERLKSWGTNRKQLFSLVGDVLSLQKIKEIIGVGLTADQDSVLALLQRSKLEITYNYFIRNRKSFRESMQPSDEDLREYWESRKSDYYSLMKRRINYFIASYDEPEEKEASEADDAKLSPEEKAKKEAEKAAAKAEADKLKEEKKKKALEEIGRKLEAIWDGLETTEGKGFAKQVRDNGYELKDTGLIAQEAYPEELKQKLRNAVDGARTSDDYIFGRKVSSDPMDSISFPIPLGESSWLMFQVKVDDPASELTFDQAKERVRVDYIEEKSLEALEEDMEKHREDMVKILERGEDVDLDKIAQSRGLKLVKAKKAKMSDTIEGIPNHSEAFLVASKVNAGKFSDVGMVAGEMGTVPEEAYFVQVVARELLDLPQNKKVLGAQLTNAEKRLEREVVKIWLSEGFEKAEAGQINPEQ